MKRPNRKAMQTAVRQFLSAAGLDVSDAHLIDTPERVTEAWANEFLKGYHQTPRRAIGEVFPLGAESRDEIVLVSGLRFVSMCPHHLMPYSGFAHVAYLPKDHVVGFGRLASLLDVYARRLILQEDLVRQVAQSLMSTLNSQGAACIIEAHQSCLQLRGTVQHGAVTHAEAYEGRMREPSFRAELWARLQAGNSRAPQ